MATHLPVLALAAIAGLFVLSRKDAQGNTALSKIVNPRPAVSGNGGYPQYPNELVAQTPGFGGVGGNAANGTVGTSNLGVKPSTFQAPSLPNQNYMWVAPYASGGPSGGDQTADNSSQRDNAPAGGWAELQSSIGLAMGVLSGGIGAAISVGTAALSTNGQPQSLSQMINGIFNGMSSGGSVGSVEAQVSGQEAALGWEGYDGAIGTDIQGDFEAAAIAAGDMYGGQETQGNDMGWGGSDWGGYDGGGYDGGGGDYGGGGGGGDSGGGDAGGGGGADG